MTPTKFTAISATTGEVLFSGTAHDIDALEAPDVVLCVGRALPSDVVGWLDEASVYHQRPEAPTWEPHVWDWALKSWVPAPPPVITAEMARAKRNRLLSACDWTQVADAPLTDQQLRAWNSYRQALRDITKQPGFPAVVWPTPP